MWLNGKLQKDSMTINPHSTGEIMSVLIFSLQH